MRNTIAVKKSKKVPIIIAISVITLLAASLLYMFILKSAQPTTNTTTEVINKENAESIAAEKSSEPTVISSADTPVSTAPTIAQPSQDTGPKVTVDDYGPSTKLDRPDVHAVVLTAYSMYNDFLFKLKSVPVDKRQSVADQYITDNSSYFGSSFNYLTSDSLHLFPQSANLDLPDSVRVYSAIVDPSDSTQVIVQIFMEPDTQWSILANVKMKDSLGNFGTFEKLTIRMNRDPL